MKKYLIALLVASVLFLILGFFPEPKEKISQNISRTAESSVVLIKDIKIPVEIADTEALRTLGLSGRESLDYNSGLLFVFDRPDRYGFWMKDMKFSIDIVWAESGRIIYIEKSVSPTTFPKVFYPTTPASLVLELPAGFCDTYDLKVGDSFLAEF